MISGSVVNHVMSGVYGDTKAAHFLAPAKRSKLGTSCASIVSFVLSEHHIPTASPRHRRRARRRRRLRRRSCAAAARSARSARAAARGRAFRDRERRPAARAAGPPRPQRRAPRADLQEALGSGIRPSRPRRRPKNGCATTTTSSGRSCSKSAAICRGAITRSCRRSSAGDGAAIRASTSSRASFVTHTAGRFDQELLRRFADAYQDIAPLTIGELWAIPIMLRLALVENLCGLAVQTLRARQDRDAARTFAAELLQIPETERRLRQLTDKASSTFLVEILHNLRDQSVASTAAWRWLQTRLGARGQSSDEVLRIEQQREAIDQLSIANIIGTMRVLSALDWPTFVEAVSRVERILRRDPAGRVRRHGSADARSLPEIGRAAVAAIGHRRARRRRARHRVRRAGAHASARTPIARITSATT